MERHELALRLGAEHRVEVGGLGSAGYAWSVESQGDNGAVGVALHAQSRSTSRTPGTGLPPDSGSTSFVLVMTGMAPGHATVRLLLRRPFEARQPPLREIVYEVTVSPAGGI